MAGKRAVYFIALAAAGAIYVAGGGWLAWVMLICAAGLPWLSLLLSVPALRNFRLEPTGAEQLEIGGEGTLWILGSCGHPMPPFRGDLRLTSCFTGEQMQYAPDRGVPTAHCGGFSVAVENPRVCDYLGIFSFRPKTLREKRIVVFPQELAIPEPESFPLPTGRWIPKPGGGFSENHELRAYRPGDQLTGIHWKLSAKTGDLMVREPVEPEQAKLLLTMDVSGSPEELDRKFGRLLWLGRWLLERRMVFGIRACTGYGMAELPVADIKGLNTAMRELLSSPAAPEGAGQTDPVPAAWQYHIGGEPDEA